MKFCALCVVSLERSQHELWSGVIARIAPDDVKTLAKQYANITSRFSGLLINPSPIEDAMTRFAGSILFLSSFILPGLPCTC